MISWQEKSVAFVLFTASDTPVFKKKEKEKKEKMLHSSSYTTNKEIAEHAL
jgi:hypothetical protein